MLNVFPIMFLAPLAHALLRVFLGATLAYLGFRHVREREALAKSIRLPQPALAATLLGLVELGAGGMLIVGAYTQVAALAVATLAAFIFLFRGRLNYALVPSRLTYFLMFGMALSLLITGAGVFAFDLPI